MTKSEQRRIEAKIREWDRSVDILNDFWRSLKRRLLKALRKVVITMDILFDWYFFYKAKDKGDKALHIFEWICVTLVILWAFRII